jgi:hypothetical protein
MRGSAFSFAKSCLASTQFALEPRAQGKKNRPQPCTVGGEAGLLLANYVLHGVIVEFLGGRFLLRVLSVAFGLTFLPHLGKVKDVEEVHRAQDQQDDADLRGDVFDAFDHIHRLFTKSQEKQDKADV